MKTPDTSPTGPETAGNIIVKPSRQNLDQVESAVQAALAALEAALAVPGLMALSDDARLRMVKPRPGSPAFINHMAIAAELHPGQVNGDVDPQAITDTLEYIRRLEPLKQRVDQLQKVIDDTIYGRLSGAWREALDVYASLQRQQAAHPQVGAALRDMGTYFRRASRGAKHPPEGPTAAPSADGGPLDLGIAE